MSDRYSRLALDPKTKQMIANMEQYGNISGDYAQMTSPAYNDLRDQGYFENYTDDEIRANPGVYDAAVAAYWDKGRPISRIDERIRGLGWLSPQRIRAADGDIEKVTAFGPYKTDEAARKVFRDRLKNAPRQRALYNSYRAENSTEAQSLGSASESEFSN